MGVAAVAGAPAAFQGRVLGIDPGLNTTGYGVLESEGAKVRLVEAGLVRSKARDSIENRLKELYDGVRDLLLSCSPDALALEQLFSHYERPRTAILMGHARGVFCLLAGLHGVPVFHYEPTRVKKLLTGNGHAPKHQMQQAVQLQLRLKSLPQPSDVADAMAIALCHVHTGPARLPHSPLSLGEVRTR